MKDAEVQTSEPRSAPVQGGRLIPAGRVPWNAHRAAAEAYNTLHRQSAERLAERGGFGWGEFAAYLLAAFDNDDLHREYMRARERVHGRGGLRSDA